MFLATVDAFSQKYVLVITYFYYVLISMQVSIFLAVFPMEMNGVCSKIELI